MSKSKIQPPAPLQPRACDVLLSLLPTHSTPDTGFLFVSPDVIQLSQQEKYNDNNVDSNECGVPAVVVGCVVGPVDEATNDAACLDRHL